MKLIAALMFTALFSAAAMAGQCPSLVGQIDQKLASAQIGEERKMEVQALRDQGQALHDQGKHAESVKVLREALGMLDSAS